MPAAATGFTATQNPSSTTVESIVQTIVGNTPFTGAKFNGHADGAAGLGGSIITTGLFSGGSDLVGIEEGLILTADADPTDLTGAENLAQDYSAVSGVNLVSPTLPEVLYNVANSALNANSAESISTLEFTIPSPASQYLKLTYSLVITENGAYNSGNWGGAVFSFPDGVGIFVKEAETDWAANQNCAVIPTTSTYVSMETAGIVAPQATVADSRVLAQSNYDDLVAPTSVAGYTPTPTTVSLGTPGAGEIAPPEIAYATNNALGIGDRFLTVPLTCVVDVSGFSSVEVGIAVANFNDALVPPAVLIAGDSVGFSGSVAPVQVSNTPEPVAAAPYLGPTSDRKVTGLSGGSATLTGTKLDTITRVVIEGKEVNFQLNKDGSLNLSIPAGLAQGTYNITTYSNYGRLVLQEHLLITGSFVPKQAFGKRLGDSQAKMYYFNPKGPGTVSFRVDGREIARHSISALGIATGSPLLTQGSDKYLVRTVKLSKDRARTMEIFVNGKRVWRGSYKAN